MAASSTTDVLRSAFPDRSVPLIAYGPSSFDRLNTTHLSTLRTTLQNSNITVVGDRTGFSPHTKWEQVIACAAHARPLEPDCIITLGGGSLTDAAKVICWMLAQAPEIDSIAGLETMSEHGYPSSFNHSLLPPKIKQIAIPTTLSGGEYQAISGMTRTDIVDPSTTPPATTQRKVLFSPPTLNPSLVILSPTLTLTTPLHTYLSTGVRALDHCIETLCSLLSNPTGDAAAIEGLKLLIPGLLAVKANPQEDLDARFQCMQGVIHAMSAVSTGVPMGASHAIGHQLGPLGVGHGETSCILLPAVCKWNFTEWANCERQEATRRALLELDAVKDLLRGALENGVEKERDLGDILDLIIRTLGMPRTLREVGVGEEQLDVLAGNSLKDHWILTNPKPITEKGQALEILEMVV